MDVTLLDIFARPLEDFLLVRVVQGHKLSRGPRSAFLLANEKSLKRKCELPKV